MGAPVLVITALIDKFPKLSFCLRYWEGGACFKGVLRGEKGIITEDETSDYSGSRGG